MRVPNAAEYSVGYRHMCNFMSMLWFRALHEYEYAMRVDEDVCLMRLPPGDLLSALSADYSFGLETREAHNETSATFTPWVQRYLSMTGLQPSIPPLPTDKIYFTNFFVSRVNWWEKSEVHHFLDAVNASGGVYQHRWGDAPIQTAALRLHATPALVLQLDVDYLHMSTHTEIVAGREVPLSAGPPVANQHFRRLAAAANATPPEESCAETMAESGCDACCLTLDDPGCAHCWDRFHCCPPPGPPALDYASGSGDSGSGDSGSGDSDLSEDLSPRPAPDDQYCADQMKGSCSACCPYQELQECAPCEQMFHCCPPACFDADLGTMELADGTVVDMTCNWAIYRSPMLSGPAERCSYSMDAYSANVLSHQATRWTPPSGYGPTNNSFADACPGTCSYHGLGPCTPGQQQAPPSATPPPQVPPSTAQCGSEARMGETIITDTSDTGLLRDHRLHTTTTESSDQPGIDRTRLNVFVPGVGMCGTTCIAAFEFSRLTNINVTVHCWWIAFPPHERMSERRPQKSNQVAHIPCVGELTPFPTRYTSHTVREAQKSCACVQSLAKNAGNFCDVRSDSKAECPMTLAAEVSNRRLLNRRPRGSSICLDKRLFD